MTQELFKPSIEPTEQEQLRNEAKAIHAEVEQAVKDWNEGRYTPPHRLLIDWFKSIPQRIRAYFCLRRTLKKIEELRQERDRLRQELMESVFIQFKLNKLAIEQEARTLQRLKEQADALSNAEQKAKDDVENP